MKILLDAESKAEIMNSFKEVIDKFAKREQQNNECYKQIRELKKKLESLQKNNSF